MRVVRVAVLAALPCVGGCAHDFGTFEPPAEGGAAAEGGQGEGGADGPCTPSARCLDIAMSCAGDCKSTETSCEAACAGDVQCRHGCRTTAMDCASACASTCGACAQAKGCPAAAACQSAAGF